MPTPPDDPSEGIQDGLNYSSESPDADQELTITFKAAKSSPLYGYKGEVYIHTGVIADGTWMFVPAAWDENISKCKMSKVEDNVWSITLAPSIRQWYNSGETSIQKLGIVIRSSDGNKKGINEDSFVTITDSKYDPFVPAEIKKGTLPAGVEPGINIVDNSTVTLVLYDLDKEGNHKDFAHVVGDFNNWKLTNDAKSQMFRDDAAGCWWITITGLDAAKEYAFQYYVGTKGGETIRLADAYCHKILDPDNDSYIPASTYPDNKTYPAGAVGIVSVFKIQKDGYSWQNANPKLDNNRLVIYEMLLRDFTATGDINGALKQLDYLKSLGVNAIELMPVQEFDGNDSWGYNPCFFFALDKAYGTERMYKEFIDACHAKGMGVIFDVVYNHATGNMPFVKLYWDSKNSKTAVNNPWFNVDAPHPYSVFHDFNHESDLVRSFVKRSLKYLLDEYHIDGFRFDLTKGFTQNAGGNSSDDNSAYDASRIKILKDYNSAIKAVKADACVILEHFCDDREQKALAEDGMKVWRKLNNAYCQSAMGYSDSSAFTELTTVGTSMPFGSYVGFMESHDEERMGFKQTKYGSGTLKTDVGDRMKQLATNAAFFFTVSGPKMVWQFGEMGYDVSIEENGRTGKKPLHWEYLDINERKALHDTYAKLISLRNNHPELFASDASFDWKVSVSDWAKGRFITLKSGNKGVVVAGNFTDKSATLSTTFPSTGVWYNYMDSKKVLQVNSSTQDITVPAHEFVLYTTFEN